MLWGCTSDTSIFLLVQLTIIILDRNSHNKNVKLYCYFKRLNFTDFKQHCKQINIVHVSRFGNKHRFQVLDTSSTKLIQQKEFWDQNMH